jgi:DNA-binding NarL/FixJ family response regulator
MFPGRECAGNDASVGEPKRVLIADEHPVIRAGLRALLTPERGLLVVGEAGDGQTLVHLVDRLVPDLVVLDVSQPQLNGMDATRYVKRARPKALVLALSVYEEPAFVRKLLDSGADGYALKRAACDELIRAVRTVLAGKAYVDPTLSPRPWQEPVSRARGALSEREAEVVRLLVQRLSLKDIAQRLMLSPRTLETYRARAMEKLGLRSRAELVRYAVRLGWLELD